MKITEQIEIPENEIHESFIRGSGPGGQNINKVATAVQLRYNLKGSAALPPHIKSRLLRNNHNRINNNGELIIEANRFRTQAKNREMARDKLRMIVTNALKKKKRRVKTKPSYRSRQARLDHKKKHSQKKSFRKKVYPD